MMCLKEGTEIQASLLERTLSHSSFLGKLFGKALIEHPKVKNRESLYGDFPNPIRTEPRQSEQHLQTIATCSAHDQKIKRPVCLFVDGLSACTRMQLCGKNLHASAARNTLSNGEKLQYTALSIANNISLSEQGNSE